MKSTIHYSSFRSKLGYVHYTHDGKNIHTIDLGSSKNKLKHSKRILKGNTILKSKNKIFEKELKEYFSGKRKTFKTKTKVLTQNAFTSRVLKALKKVPYGKTISYRDLAKKIKNPNAFRAVGNALGKNPCPILIPCHRIIKSDGSLGGFTGGISYKKKLLKIEGLKY